MVNRIELFDCLAQAKKAVIPSQETPLLIFNSLEWALPRWCSPKKPRKYLSLNLEGYFFIAAIFL